MKLIYATPVRIPTKNAHGFQIMNMCAAFAAAGVETELVVPKRRNLLSEDPFTFYNVPRNFTIKTLPAIDLFGGFVPEKICNILNVYSFLVSVKLYLLHKKFDVLYTRDPALGMFFKNYVIEIHMPEHVNIWGYKPKKIVVLTSHIKKVLVQIGVAASRVLVAPDAVNLALFQVGNKDEARRALNLPSDKRIVLYWGNFKKWKGVDVLVDAAADLKDCVVVLVGGTKDTDVRRLRERCSAETNIIIEGFKPQTEEPLWLAAADVLVIPNTAKDDNSLLYTSPMKLFEYLSAARPIVAADLPSLRDVLDETTAVFFEADNPHGLAKAIKDILENIEKAKAISLAARRKAEEHTWERRAQSALSFIEND